MSTNINRDINRDTEAIINKLYDIKKQQKSLRELEKDLKAAMLIKMANSKLHKDDNGTIEKIDRKPKKIYDRDLLQAVLGKRGISDDIVEDIIKESTRRINVSEHLSVKVRHSK